MTQLTKEHFDEQLKKLVTKDELSARLTDQTRQLKDYTDTQLTKLREEMKEGFQNVDLQLAAIHEMLDVRKRVEVLENKVQHLEHKNPT